MPTTTTSLISVFEIKVNSVRLPVGQLSKVQDVRVEQNRYLPDQCTITFRDTGTGEDASDPLVFGLADNTTFMPIGHDIEVLMGKDINDTQTVFKGEIIAQDLDSGSEYDHAPTLTVRCFDRAHRLQRGRFTRSFTNMTDSDIASQLAADAGLAASTDSTSEVYPFVLQNNQTNFEFLRERAGRIGFELYVDDRKMYFKKAPTLTESTPVTKRLWEDIVRMRVCQTSVGQIQEMMVRGWDNKKKEAITSTQSSGAASAATQLKVGSQLAAAFSLQPKAAIVSRPVLSQSEAGNVAQAALDDLTKGAISLEADAIGDPALKPGAAVKIQGASDRFSGDYYVTSATHRCGAGRPYHTTIRVDGRRDGTMLELVGANGHGNGRPYGHGVGESAAIGVVTNNNDEDGLGRVKVKLPWLNNAGGTEIETDWARLVIPGGGADRGIYFLPEVNDEVLVAFEHGDPSRPYVIGGLWNQSDVAVKKNSQIRDGEGKVTQRIIKSRSGHIITIDDSSDHSAIKIVDSSGQNTFTIDTQNKKIIISAEQDLELKAGQNVKITAGQNFSVKADQNCSVEATNNATFKGLATSIQGENTCEVKGNTSAKLGGAMVSVEASGNCAVKGAMVMIN